MISCSEVSVLARLVGYLASLAACLTGVSSFMSSSISLSEDEAGLTVDLMGLAAFTDCEEILMEELSWTGGMTTLATFFS